MQHAADFPAILLAQPTLFQQVGDQPRDGPVEGGQQPLRQGPGGGLLVERLELARVVRDVLDVHADQHQDLDLHRWIGVAVRVR